LAGAAKHEFRYSAHPLSFQTFAFVRGRPDCGRFYLSMIDYGTRGGLGIRSGFSFGASVFVCLADLGVTARCPGLRIDVQVPGRLLASPL
jgi:hypothetical protein